MILDDILARDARRLADAQAARDRWPSSRRAAACAPRGRAACAAALRAAGRDRVHRRDQAQVALRRLDPPRSADRPARSRGLRGRRARRAVGADRRAVLRRRARRSRGRAQRRARCRSLRKDFIVDPLPDGRGARGGRRRRPAHRGGAATTRRWRAAGRGARDWRSTCWSRPTTRTRWRAPWRSARDHRHQQPRPADVHRGPGAGRAAASPDSRRAASWWPSRDPRRRATSRGCAPRASTRCWWARR